MAELRVGANKAERVPKDVRQRVQASSGFKTNLVVMLDSIIGRVVISFTCGVARKEYSSSLSGGNLDNQQTIRKAFCVKELACSFTGVCIGKKEHPLLRKTLGRIV